ncbi:MAG: hypothetical protein H0X18_07405 [Geodermatophilaceae bacterium]|nr:hypothetical protein [Geodermatophilaceae bacterium]
MPATRSSGRSTSTPPSRSAILTGGAGRATGSRRETCPRTPLPYLYVAPWYPDDKPDSAYWSAGTMAVLRYADLLAEPDPAGTALSFLREGRSLLSGQES